MIRLFRKIRQQLLSEDKYPVYLLYASGEILLVVIGILLALQIDNWNDRRNERIREMNYLKAIKNDLELNVSIIHRFEEKNNTFKELENSGQLALISNREIKNLLLDMDLIYRRIEFYSDHLYNDLRELNYAILFHKVDLDPSLKNLNFQLSGGTLGEDVEPSIEQYRILLGDLGYKNNFVLSNYSNHRIIAGLEEILEKSERLIVLIDEELK